MEIPEESWWLVAGSGPEEDPVAMPGPRPGRGLLTLNGPF